MKKNILYLVCSICLLSCTKEIKEVIEITEPTPATVQFKIDKVINDSTIALSWSKLSAIGFQKYRIIRNAVILQNGFMSPYSEAIDSGNDVNRLAFTDKSMPLAREISYELQVSSDTTLFRQGYRGFALVRYERPNSLIYASPKDVLFNRQQQSVYFTEANRIMRIDLASGRITAARDFPAGLGYCSLGTFNGNSELYVPNNDGWLHIIDAATLELKDRIYVAGTTMSSVVAADNKLFVSSSDLSGDGNSTALKVYDRPSKTLIGRTGFRNNSRLLLLESSAFELVEASINLTPVDLASYSFSGSGTPVSKAQDKYHGDYPIDAGIMRSFPDGNRFITSTSGVIYNKSLVFEGYVKRNTGFSDYAFSASGSVIYAAYFNQRKIDVISYPSMTTTGSYTTNLVPHKIFTNGNKLLCIGKVGTGLQMSYYFVENINL